jgi:two-component system, NtrC family, nitrogen regulation sensor histidine kinase NtrY
VTFRSKLFVNFILALLVSVALIAVGVTLISRQAFEHLNREHTIALVQQFQHEYDRRKEEVQHRVKGIAEEQATTLMAVDLSRPNSDVSVYVNDAHGVSQSHQLDFLDFVATDGSIISSEESPARFGYKLDWVTQTQDWASRGAFLMKMETSQGPQLGLISVSTVRVGDRNLYVVGGERLDQKFLESLVLPEGTRALLYLNLDPEFQSANLLDAKGTAPDADRLASLVQREQKNPSPQSERIVWSVYPANAEEFHAIPLPEKSKDMLALFLVGSSQNAAIALERQIRNLSVGVALAGLLFGLALSWWAAKRVTEPVQELVVGTQQVADGNWNARVPVHGKDEIGQLAKNFNGMTQQLVEQRDKLVQVERVAAWRELARRLAHELKNPLFPLQTTVENLQTAHDHSPSQFDEVFRESTGILITEIQNLKTIVSRFSDFAKMPQPELHAVNLNDIVRNVVKLFEAQFSAVGRPPITPELHLEESLPLIQADATLLHRAIENLVLNAMDAMPGGGVLMLRTMHTGDDVRLEVSDTGAGLTPEETERIFTPYYTSKQHGTGLGLAIVQAVVADHGGSISVESETGVGTSFHIDLPVHPAKVKTPDLPVVFEKTTQEA